MFQTQIDDSDFWKEVDDRYKDQALLEAERNAKELCRQLGLFGIRAEVLSIRHEN